MGSLYFVDLLDAETMHVTGWLERGGVRFPCAAQDGVQAKIQGLLISRRFHLIIFQLVWTLEVENGK